MKARLLTVCVPFALASGVATSDAHAAILSATGGITQIAPPVSLMPGQEAHGTFAVAIDEMQNVPFSGVVDRINPQLATNYTATNAGSFALSTFVCSHIIHFDDTNLMNPPINVVGTVTFSSPILAFIYRDFNLDQSDAPLGNITTLYPSTVPFRGFATAYSGLDTVRLINPTTIEVTLGSGIDQIRVLTVGVPTPGVMALVPMVGLVASRRRR